MSFASGTKESNIVGKPNQDRCVCESPMRCSKSWHLFFVADGHGTDGHVVSQFVAETLPQCMQRLHSQRKLPAVSSRSKSSWLKAYVQFIRDAIVDTNERLARSSSAGGVSEESGCTLCGMWVVHGVGIVFNVGDSRAVYVLGEGGPSVQITRDHKPDDDREMKRIKKHGGHVARLSHDSPARLWHSKAMMAPGLALSRALGDFGAVPCGLTHLPAVSTTTFAGGFIVIASDGLWDYLTNEQVAALSAKKRSAKSYCSAIMQAALKASEGGYRDDCTAVVVAASAFATEG